MTSASILGPASQVGPVVSLLQSIVLAPARKLVVWRRLKDALDWVMCS